MIQSKITFTEGTKVVFQTDIVLYALFYQVMRGYGEHPHDDAIDRASVAYRFYLDYMSEVNPYTVADYFADLTKKRFELFDSLESGDEQCDMFNEDTGQ
jgi:hypothetical protein